MLPRSFRPRGVYCGGLTQLSVTMRPVAAVTEDTTNSLKYLSRLVERYLPLFCTLQAVLVNFPNPQALTGGDVVVPAGLLPAVLPSFQFWWRLWIPSRLAVGGRGGRGGSSVSVSVTLRVSFSFVTAPAQLCSCGDCRPRGWLSSEEMRCCGTVFNRLFTR